MLGHLFGMEGKGCLIFTSFSKKKDFFDNLTGKFEFLLLIFNSFYSRFEF